uniref:Secreted protein n=1 Tax=Vespula pensylvanica TaxID=30213 RepID=A0A834P8I1_VESPE|nr:hypothetical protein H0235_005209 [Vespula pensylvanica]
MLLSSAKYLTLLVLSTVPFPDSTYGSLSEAAGSSSKRTTSPLLTPDNSTDLTALRSPLLTVNSVNVSQRCTMQHHDGYLRVTDRDRIGFRNATRGVIATGHKNVTPKRTAE